MTCFYFKKLKIQIEFTFFILLLIIIALDFREQFFILYITVTIHECSHILMSKILNMNLEKIVFTPIGEIAVIENFESFEKWKRLLVTAAGPLVNLILYFIFDFFQTESAMLYKKANLSIALFNLLPVFPLDGGRIVQILLDFKIKRVVTDMIVLNIGKIICCLLFLLGVMQVILYPFNISMLCLSFYLLRNNQRVIRQNSFEFYKSIAYDIMKSKNL